MATKKKKSTNNKENKIFSSKIVRSIILLSVILGISFLLDKLGIKLANMFNTPTLFDIFYFFTLIGEGYVFIWICIFISLILFINKKPAVTFILTIITTTAANILIKMLINRPRPFEALNIPSIISTSSSSFPSGHAMILFCIIPMISKSFPKTKIFVWIIAILVSISRVYLGVHYVSDIVAGAIFGYIIGYVGLKISERYSWKY